MNHILNTLLEKLPGHIFWKDKAGVLQGCNDNLASFLKLSSRNEIVGKTDYDLANKEEADRIRKLDNQVINSGGNIEVEEMYTLPSGDQQYYLTLRSPIKKQNLIVGVLAISVNITERKQAEIAKNNFIRDMGHDFRTPLAFIQGLSTMIQFADEGSTTIKQIDEAIDLLREESSKSNVTNKLRELKNKLESEKKERLEQTLLISTSCDRVLDFFKEILDYSQSASGALTNDPVETSIPAFINFLDELYAPGIKSKGITFNATISDLVPKTLMLDKTKLKRILMNLMGNSIKFTDEGSITLSVDYIKKNDKAY